MQVPETRFDLNQHYDAGGAATNTTSADQGAFLDRPGFFDNRLFDVSPREAFQMDPLQRMLLTTSWEALEMAGYSKDASLSTQSNRIATYFGQAADDWRDILNNDEIDIYYVPGLSRAFGPGRLAYHHKWGGGTYSLDSACATSTTAIHLACQALASRECDTAIAGGGSILVSPMTFAGLSKSGMISDHGGCRTFHDDADGYARGEGVGVVVLKRLEDAVSENDNILGVVTGHARTYTTTSTSITHPSAESQARVYREVLRQTATAPDEIAYVEMHGTGTQAGDVEEMTSVIQVLGKQRTKANVLTVGAVKANVGHGEGAAGVTSLIKVLMMMREKRIPPQPGYPFKVNRNFPSLEALNIRIAGTGGRDSTLRPSPASRNGKVKCLISTFDASGGNTSLVVEEAPDLSVKSEHPIRPHVITLSAKTTVSLRQNQTRLLDHLVRNPSIAVADLAYSTTARRMHEALRVAYTGHTITEIVKAIRDDLVDSTRVITKKPKPTKVIFSFTGQGSQYAGMGKGLFQHCPDFRVMLENYQHICELQNLPRFLHLISDEKTAVEKSSTVAVQLAIVAVEIAIARLLKSWGVEPDLVIGHSLGEYSALCIAGVISASDVLYLVGRRAQLMEHRLVSGQYAMLAIAKSMEYTTNLLAARTDTWGNTQVACSNAPELTVVSGPVKEIKHLQTVMEMQESRSTMLRTPFGFHSHHMDPILEDFASVAQSVTFAPPIIPVASTVLGRIVDSGDRIAFNPAYLVRQTRDCVNFTGAVKACQALFSGKIRSTWIEAGPEPVTIGLARRSVAASEDQFLFSMKSTEDNWTSITALLASLYRNGAAIKWPRFHKPFLSSLTLLRLPTYAFEEKNYWKAYVERSSGQTSSAAKTNSLAVIPQFSTTSLQWVEAEEVRGREVSATFASRTSEPDFFAAVQGHLVNGTAIMSMSMFCDMARSAAQYAYQRAYPDQTVPHMSIYDVEMTHALVIQNKDPEQVVKTKITFSGTADSSITFSSTTKETSLVEHGTMRVVFEDSQTWFAEQKQTAYLIGTRIRSLKDISSQGSVHRLLKPVIYRLFSNLVAYGPDYRAMDEVWIDGDCQDAAATIKLPTRAGKGNFLYDPFWSDGAVHLGGFLLNGGLKYEDDTVCLCTGLASWRLIDHLKADETYTTYTAIQETESPNMLSGSAYVFDSHNKLVQVATGMVFQKMNKATMAVVLKAGSPHRSPGVTSEKTRNRSSRGLAKFCEPAVHLTHSAPLSQVDSSRSDLETDSGYATPEINMQTDNMQALFSIVSLECGCNESDLEPSTAFSDVGVDSLMAITIIASFRKKTGIELPVTFFLDHQTVQEANEALGSSLTGEATTDHEIHEPVSSTRDGMSSSNIHQPRGQMHEQPTWETKHPSEHITLPVEEVDYSATSVPSTLRHTISSIPSESSFADCSGSSATSVPTIREENTQPAKPSQIILLNGSPSSECAKLFLLPDGSGSPGCYIGLPSLSASLNIYAVQSPYVKCPAELTCSVRILCESFVQAIQAVQHTGPYLLGGYSYGALYAYEVTRILLERGLVVDGLFIIDMAVPKPIELPCPITQQLLLDSGLLPTKGPVSSAQKEHYLSTVRMMVAYKPTACLTLQPKRTVLLTSKEPLASGKQSSLATWAQGAASTTRGWEKLVAGPIEHIDVAGTHFTLLKYPNVSQNWIA